MSILVLIQFHFVSLARVGATTLNLLCVHLDISFADLSANFCWVYTQERAGFVTGYCLRVFISTAKQFPRSNNFTAPYQQSYVSHFDFLI